MLSQGEIRNELHRAINHVWEAQLIIRHLIDVGELSFETFLELLGDVMLDLSTELEDREDDED